MTIKPDLSALCAEVKAEFPDFVIVKKSDFGWMRALGHVLGNRFMTDYVTTVKDTVYVPDAWETWPVGSRCAIIRHERIHMRQARRMTFPVFTLLYLMVFFPICLSYFRAIFEKEAYTESLRAFRDYGMDYTSSRRRQWLAYQFASSAYGWMWPFPSAIDRWFDEAVRKVDAGA